MRQFNRTGSSQWLARAALRYATQQRRHPHAPPADALGYEEVDADGMTPMDRRHAEQHVQVRKVLTTPFATLRPDGSYRPDFLIGLKQYSHRIRDEYRHIISQRLGLPLPCIKLSTGWSEKLDIRQMRDTRTVLGVTLLKPTSDPIADRPSEALEESPEKASMISEFIDLVNRREDEQLTTLTIMRAAVAAPEVEAGTDEYQLEFTLARDAVFAVTRKFAAVIFMDSRERWGRKLEVWLPAFHQRRVVPLIIDMNCSSSSSGDSAIVHLYPPPQLYPEKSQHVNQELGKAVPGRADAATDAITADRDWLVKVLRSASGVADTSGAAPEAAGVLDVPMPAVYIHGTYVGSERQLDYLCNNSEALTGLLLRPHQLEVKEKYRVM